MQKALVMKRFVAILVFALCAFCAEAQLMNFMYQPPEYNKEPPVYIIGKFTRIIDMALAYKEDGLYRRGRVHGMFYCTNRALDYTLAFSFLKTEYPSKDLEILDLPISDLEQFENIILAENFLKLKSLKEASDLMWEFFYRRWKGKTYFIDSSECYKSDPELKEPDRMKAIQVEVYPCDIPKLPLPDGFVE